MNNVIYCLFFCFFIFAGHISYAHDIDFWFCFFFIIANSAIEDIGMANKIVIVHLNICFKCIFSSQELRKKGLLQMPFYFFTYFFIKYQRIILILQTVYRIILYISLFKCQTKLKKLWPRCAASLVTAPGCVPKLGILVQEKTWSEITLHRFENFDGNRIFKRAVEKSEGPWTRVTISPVDGERAPPPKPLTAVAISLNNRKFWGPTFSKGRNCYRLAASPRSRPRKFKRESVCTCVWDG